MSQTKEEAKRRLEYLRAELRDGCISYGELDELRSLAPFIDKEDVELLEAAGVPEFPNEDDDPYDSDDDALNAISEGLDAIEALANSGGLLGPEETKAAILAAVEKVRGGVRHL